MTDFEFERFSNIYGFGRYPQNYSAKMVIGFNFVGTCGTIQYTEQQYTEQNAGAIGSAVGVLCLT